MENKILEYFVDKTGFIIVFLFLLLFLSLTAGKKTMYYLLLILLFSVVMTNIDYLQPLLRRYSA
jgi:hypothetical protein